MTNDLRILHGEALALATERVATLRPDDLARATPCVGWSLADLLAHMIGQHRGFAQAVRESDAPAEAYRPVPFEPDTWHESVSELRSAVSGADLSGTAVAVELSRSPLPMARVIAAQLIDTVVHTWDIAQSVGLDFTPPHDLLAASAAIAAAIPDPAYGPGRPFATRLPADGDIWQRTLALVGRRSGALTGRERSE